MIFDIIFLVSDRKLKTTEEKNTAPELFRMFIRPEHFVSMQILKDPVEDHTSTYLLEFVNLDKDVIDYVKNNIVESIVIRVGKGAQVSGTPNYNLLKLYIKPIKLIIPDPDRTTVNNITISGIGSNTYALMVDKSFSTNMSAPENLQEVSVETGYAGKTEKTKSTYNNSSITLSGSATGTNRTNKNTVNHNPGNLINTDVSWLGLTGNDGTFETFANDAYGFRALVINLNTKISRGANTLRKLIDVWAPPSDKNYHNVAYINLLSNLTGLGLDEPIKESDYANIAKGISWFEGDNTNKVFTDESINTGVAMAGYKSYTTYPGSIGINNANMSTIEAINAGYKVSNPDTVTSSSGSTYGSTSYINNNSMLTGMNLLNTVISSLTEKYQVQFLNDPVVVGGVSKFVYPKIFTPNLDAFEMIRYIYEWYPPFYLNSPWLLDDAYYTDGDEIKVGQTMFIPLNIFNMAALPSPDVSIIKYINSVTGSGAVTSVFNVVDRNFFYKDYDLPKFKTLCYNHRCLADNKETTIQPNSTTYELYLPILDEANPSTISANKKIVDVAETINVETNYDAVEFQTRLNYIEKHMDAQPELYHYKIISDDLNYFQFGKKYYLTDDTTYAPMTPYKILQTYTNVSGNLKLEQDILFYSSGLDLTTTSTT